MNRFGGWRWEAQGRGAEATEAIAVVLQYPQIDQSTQMTRQTIRESAESLRSELERELDPNTYQIAWREGPARKSKM